jgi:hypothetical protein
VRREPLEKISDARLVRRLSELAQARSAVEAELAQVVAEFTDRRSRPPAEPERDRERRRRQARLRAAGDRRLLAEGYVKEQSGPHNARSLKFQKHYRESLDAAA